MKILLLAHRLPYPLESGQHLRLYHLARHLARRNQLHLVTFGAPPLPAALTDVFHTITTMPLAAVAAPGSMVRRLLRATAVDELIPRSEAMEARIRAFVASERPDVVWIGGWDMLIYAPALAPVPVVADVMDEGLLECTREALRARSLPGLLTSLRRLVLYVRWERHFLPMAGRCVFVSAVDARWARRVVPRLALEIVENGVDAEHFRPLGLDEDFPSLVFEGNQGFPPNADAVAYFARGILPAVLARFPACRFFVVGREPVPATRRLAGPNIVVTDRVDDVRLWLDRASVFVCPMRTGAGIKNKILQAWAMAKPVVATRVAIGGLGCAPGEDIVVADGARDFARETIRLLEDPLRRAHLGKCARETAMTSYTWERQAAALETILRAT